jgi:hypothetical protein
MKRCPTCDRTYTDEALSFCPNDGTPLVTDTPPASFDPQATIMASPPKVSAPSGPFDQPPPTDWPSSPPPAANNWSSQTPSSQPSWPSQTPSAPSDWSGGTGGYQPIQPPSQGSTGFQPPPPPAYPGTGPKQQGFAIGSLVCGILSIVCCMGIFTGIPAVILGIMAMNKEKENPTLYGGRGMALAGVITGGIGSVIGTIWLLLQIVGLMARM